MFLCRGRRSSAYPRFPHAGGDVSAASFSPSQWMRFSPRRWGCFPLRAPEVHVGAVFPTQVGMFPRIFIKRVQVNSFPHAGGDVSQNLFALVLFVWFSPRRWGCFHREGLRAMSPPVFPTQVGMFLLRKASTSTTQCFPHAGGDVSTGQKSTRTLAAFSPRRWGCFRRDEPQRDPPSVFPTQVGMFPRELTPSRVGPRFPHAGGDVSSDERRCAVVVPFSPRRWGCF